MIAQNIYQRITSEGVLTSSDRAEVFTEWNRERESWLFVAPHDDDVVCGAGLTFLSALAEVIETHAAIITRGNMGYCHLDQRERVADIRRAEAEASFSAMGLPLERLRFLNFADGNLANQSGRRFIRKGDDPMAIAGAEGLQNSFTWLLRAVRPTRVFIPADTDLHSDHREVNSELIISVFHAQGTIWPELGVPISEIPCLYEYATYSDFAEPPNMRIRVSDDLLEKKLDGIAAYKSQEQIELLIDVQRQAGGQEYLRELEFDIMQPGKYDHLFDQ